MYKPIIYQRCWIYVDNTVSTADKSLVCKQSVIVHLWPLSVWQSKHGYHYTYRVRTIYDLWYSHSVRKWNFRARLQSDMRKLYQRRAVRCRQRHLHFRLFGGLPGKHVHNKYLCCYYYCKRWIRFFIRYIIISDVKFSKNNLVSLIYILYNII